MRGNMELFLKNLGAYIKAKWHIILYFVFLIICIIFLCIASTSRENYRFQQYDSIPFENQWSYEFPDGTTGTTDLPAQLEAGDVDTLTLTNYLPENLPEGMVFIYRSRHTIAEIYIDGKLRYNQAAQTTGANKIEETLFPLPGTIWTEVILSTEDSGKEIRIELNGIVQSYLKGPGEVYIGDRASFLLKLVQERKGTIAGAVLLMFLAVCLLALWIILVITTRNTYRDCLCLALFTASISLWQFTETRCLQFLFPNMKVLSLLAYEILLLAPIPIALYYSYGKRKRTVYLSKIAVIIALVVWIVENTLHFLHVADISEMLIATQSLDLFETAFLAYIQISDIISDAKEGRGGSNARFWWIPLVGLSVFVPLTTIEFLRYIFGVGGKRSDDAILTSVGMVAYIISLAFSSVMKLVSENIQEKQANEAKTQFLANMSHEIRTPLNAVLGFDEMILRYAKDEKIVDYATSIQSAGTSLRDIINSILDLTKIEAGRMEMIESEYNTVQLLDNVSSMVAALAEQKGLSVALDIDENLPEHLWGDEVHIRQVLTNLMTNAVKYTQKGGVIFKVQMVEKPDEEGNCKILFSVKDTGIGIREEDRGRLFEKFQRLDYDKNKNVEGTGLGMNIVVKLLEAMHSKIELESVYGKGSEFYFVLKQKVLGEDTVGSYGLENSAHHSEMERAKFIAPAARILIVDDVLLNLQVACGLLEGLKMEIDTAESGLGALDMVQKHHYDVILMDHMMPGMDGIETANKIRELAKTTGDSYYADVPILALTANALSGMKEKFLEEGLQDFIGKPVEGKELERALRKWLPEEKIILRDEEEAETVEETPKAEEWDVPIAEIDLEVAKAYAPDKEMYMDMLHTYLTAIPETRERIERFKEERDEKNYTITVHGLKSSSKLVGAMEVSETAKALEELSHAGKFEEAWEKTPHLLELYRVLENDIRAYLSEDEKIESAVLSEDEMRQHLAGLKEAAEEFDMDAFLDWEKQMEHVEVQEAYREKWQELQTAVRNVAFLEVIEIIEQI